MNPLPSDQLLLKNFLMPFCSVFPAWPSLWRCECKKSVWPPGSLTIAEHVASNYPVRDFMFLPQHVGIRAGSISRRVALVVVIRSSKREPK